MERLIVSIGMPLNELAKMNRWEKVSYIDCFVSWLRNFFQTGGRWINDLKIVPNYRDGTLLVTGENLELVRRCASEYNDRYKYSICPEKQYQQIA